MKTRYIPLAALLICSTLLLAVSSCASRKCDGSRARHTPMGKM